MSIKKNYRIRKGILEFSNLSNPLDKRVVISSYLSSLRNSYSTYGDWWDDDEYYMNGCCDGYWGDTDDWDNYSRYWDSFNDDDYYDCHNFDEYYEGRYGRHKNRSGKRHHGKSKSFSSKNHLVFEDRDIDEVIPDGGYETVDIRYYRDYNDSDNYEEFHNLYEFDEFCSSEGIRINDECLTHLFNHYGDGVLHCCINPRVRNESKELELMVEDSYGSLRWECAECDDEFLNK